VVLLFQIAHDGVRGVPDLDLTHVAVRVPADYESWQFKEIFGFAETVLFEELRVIRV
jgi:hypothetical protein